MIQWTKDFFIRPRATFSNKFKHLYHSKRYEVVGVEEIEERIKIKGIKKKQLQTRIIYYVPNNLNELTGIDNSECTLEIYNPNFNKTLLRK